MAQQDVGLKAILTPELDEREAERETEDLQTRLEGAVEDMEMDLDTDAISEQVEEGAEDSDLSDILSDSDLVPDSISNALGSGGGEGDEEGGKGGLAGLLGGSMSKGGLLKVALAGAVAVGILKGIQKLAGVSPALSRVLEIFEAALSLFFRPFGNFLADLLLPWAEQALGMATLFNKYVEEDGLPIALMKIGGELLRRITDSFAEDLGFDVDWENRDISWDLSDVDPQDLLLKVFGFVAGAKILEHVFKKVKPLQILKKVFPKSLKSGSIISAVFTKLKAAPIIGAVFTKLKGSKILNKVFTVLKPGGILGKIFGRAIPVIGWALLIDWVFEYITGDSLIDEVFERIDDHGLIVGTVFPEIGGDPILMELFGDVMIGPGDIMDYVFGKNQEEREEDMADKLVDATVGLLEKAAGGDLPRKDDERSARGGIVKSPTRILAGEAGPEAIIPLDRDDQPQMAQERRESPPQERKPITGVGDRDRSERLLRNLKRTLRELDLDVSFDIDGKTLAESNNRTKRRYHGRRVVSR